MFRKFGKVLSLLLAISLIVCAFAACAGNDENSPVKDGAGIDPGTADGSGTSETSDVIEHRVISSSMAPTLIMGHTYLFQPIDDDMTFQVSDIVLVTYYVEGYSDPITAPKRIVEINVTDGTVSYTMKGDNNDMVDHPSYQREQILGKYIGEKE